MSGDIGSNKPSQVSNEIGIMSGVIADLESQVSRLSEAINPVLSGSSEELCKDVAPPQSDIVPLAHTIRDCRYNIRDQVARLLDILDRIEL